MKQAAQARAEEKRDPNWAVIEYHSFRVIQDDFDSREKAEEWLESVPTRGPATPEWVKNQDNDIRVVNISG